MNFNQIIQQLFNYPLNPTNYQINALYCGLNSPYLNKDSTFIILAAYFILCSRQYLPEKLSTFLPQNIKQYSIDPELLLSSDKRLIKKYIKEIIEPDFIEIKDSFFKLGGMSAKTKLLTRANSLENIYNALCNSDRYLLEYQFSYVLQEPVVVFFNQLIPDAATEREIRVMIKNNKIQGVSSYKMNGKSSYSSNFIPNAIEFLKNDVLPHTIDWQQDFVIDILERKNKNIQIIEFNPYFTSMPCFYGDYKNIGDPFIIEDDRYGATKMLKEIMVNPLPFLTHLK